MPASGPPDDKARTRIEESAIAGRQLRWSRWLRWELNTFAGRWTRRPVPEKAAILVAGCGAAVAVEYARSFPDGYVVAVETSEEGARQIETLAAGLSRRNLAVERREASGLADVPGRYDVVVLSRALSLAEAPAELLQELLARLREDGVLALTFRSARRDYLLHDFRSLVGLLERAPTSTSRVELGEAVTHGFDFTDTRLLETVDYARDVYGADRWAWADRFLRPAGRQVRLADALATLDTAGLSFLGWMEPARWHLGPRLLDDRVRESFDALPERLRWEFIDRVLAPPYRLFAGRATDAAPERPWMTDDGLLLGSPVHPAEWMETTEVAPTGQLRRAYVLRPAPNERDHVILETPARSEYRLHELFEGLLRNMDGHRTLREVIEVAVGGPAEDRVVRKVLNVVRRLLEPHGVLVLGPPPGSPP